MAERGERPKGASVARSWLPASEKQKEMLRDGEPVLVALRHYEGEPCVRGSYWLGCCDCGLRHLNVVEMHRDGRRLFAVVRFYRDNESKSKAP